MKNTEQKIPALRFPEFSGEWEEKRLGEITSIITGSTPSTSVKEYYDGDKLFVSPFDIQGNRIVYSTKTKLTNIGFSKGRKVKEGSVLFVCIGSTIGKVAVAGNECVTNQQINSLFSKKGFENNFIYSVLEKNASRIKLLAGVQAVPQINKTDFSKLVFPFPSLPEQQKIADFLSAVDKRLQLLKDKKTKLEEYKRGVMQRIFSQELRFTHPDGSAYPDWEEKRLGEISKSLRSGGTPTSTNKDYYDGNIPFLSISDMTAQGKYLENTNKKVSKEGIDNSSSWIVPVNSLIYSMYASIGFVSITKIELAISQAVICVQLMEGYSLEYIYYFLLNFRKSIYRYVETGTQGNINAQIVKNICVDLPCLDEQRQIADFLSAIDDKISLLSKQIQSTGQYKKGLLQQMFV